jgi:hypothetical protein
LPLPTTSIGAVVLLLGLVVGLALGTSSGPLPVQDVREPAAEPGVTNIGGDEPPMEYTPRATTSVRSPTRTPVTSPPAQSRPVLTPQGTPEKTPEMSVAETTQVPLPDLPSLASTSEAPGTTSARDAVPGAVGTR